MGGEQTMPTINSWAVLMTMPRNQLFIVIICAGIYNNVRDEAC